MSKVYAIQGVPTLADFYGHSGTPLVIDTIGKKGYFLADGDIVTELAGGGAGEMNVQADWTQADNAQDDFIKNKPTLGALAAKSSVDYSTSEVTNKPASLPASDVSAWAKAATKPTYTASEVGAEDPSNKVTTWTATTTDVHYPSEKLVKDSLDALLPIDFYPASMVVNTGTLDGGTVASLSLLDGTFVSISEVGGADPLRVTFSFTGVTRMSAFAFYGYYAGSPSHQLSVEIYNPNTTGWDVLGIVGSEASAQWYSFTIHGEENYINSGAVSTRIRHIQNGIATHDLFLDYLELNYGAVGGSASISASSVIFTPFGNISATNVGAALVELDSEKLTAAQVKSLISIRF